MTYFNIARYRNNKFETIQRKKSFEVFLHFRLEKEKTSSAVND